MKIIDRNTGRRIDGKASPEIKDYKRKMQEEDPIIRNIEKQNDSEELSAMDPPAAYDEKRKVGGNKNEMNSFLQELMKEHSEMRTEIKKFDDALKAFKENSFQINNELHKSFNNFFIYFDENILPHNQKEEKFFFRVLEQRMKENGEHGKTNKKYTAIELMEDDHVKFIQLTTLCFNFLGLGARLQDMQSRGLTLDIAYNSGRELVELLNLHAFREDETIFPMAQKLLTEDDFNYINEAHRL